MARILRFILVILIAAALYLVAWPVPIDPKAWDAPKFDGYRGPFASNNALASYDALSMDGLSGPEAVIDNGHGTIYATTHEGWILKWSSGDDSPQRFVNAQGRPLGIAFDADGNLWIANAYLGLQKATPKGEVSLQLTETEGIPIRYADDLAIVPNGKIYFSDASTKFGAAASNDTLAASLLDIMEHGDHGRIIEYDPATDESRVVMKGMTFANGVAAAENGDFILVAETGGYQIWKHWLAGEKIGQTELLMENLPGFPDNIHRGNNGRFWVGLTTKRADILDELSAKPFWRKVVQRLPAFMQPNVEPYGHVFAIDENGRVLHSLQDPQGSYPATTGAWETDDFLYVSSLTAPELARYPKAEVGVTD